MIRKGFTLVELLVVMAVLAVLAGGLIVAINPADKIRQANDTKVQNDISQIASAASGFAANNEGGFPSASGDLVPGELTIYPSAPTGTGYNAYVLTGLPGGCTAAAKTCTSVTVTGNLTSSKYVGYTTWRYDSATARACAWNGTLCKP